MFLTRPKASSSRPPRTYLGPWNKPSSLLKTAVEASSSKQAKQQEQQQAKQQYGPRSEPPPPIQPSLSDIGIEVSAVESPSTTAASGDTELSPVNSNNTLTVAILEANNNSNLNDSMYSKVDSNIEDSSSDRGYDDDRGQLQHNDYDDEGDDVTTASTVLQSNSRHKKKYKKYPRKKKKLALGKTKTKTSNVNDSMGSDSGLLESPACYDRYYCGPVDLDVTLPDTDATNSDRRKDGPVDLDVTLDLTLPDTDGPVDLAPTLPNTDGPVDLDLTLPDTDDTPPAKASSSLAEPDDSITTGTTSRRDEPTEEYRVSCLSPPGLVDLDVSLPLSSDEEDNNDSPATVESFSPSQNGADVDVDTLLAEEDEDSFLTNGPVDVDIETLLAEDSEEEENETIASSSSNAVLAEDNEEAENEAIASSSSNAVLAEDNEEEEKKAIASSSSEEPDEWDVTLSLLLEDDEGDGNVEDHNYVNLSNDLGTTLPDTTDEQDEAFGPLPSSPERASNEQQGVSAWDGPLDLDISGTTEDEDDNRQGLPTPSPDKPGDLGAVACPEDRPEPPLPSKDPFDLDAAPPISNYVIDTSPELPPNTLAPARRDEKQEEGSKHSSEEDNGASLPTPTHHPSHDVPPVHSTTLPVVDVDKETEDYNQDDSAQEDDDIVGLSIPLGDPNDDATQKQTTEPVCKDTGGDSWLGREHSARLSPEEDSSEYKAPQEHSSLPFADVDQEGEGSDRDDSVEGGEDRGRLSPELDRSGPNSPQEHSATPSTYAGKSYKVYKYDESLEDEQKKEGAWLSPEGNDPDLEARPENSVDEVTESSTSTDKPVCRRLMFGDDDLLFYSLDELPESDTSSTASSVESFTEKVLQPAVLSHSSLAETAKKDSVEYSSDFTPMKLDSINSSEAENLPNLSNESEPAKEEVARTTMSAQCDLSVQENQLATDEPKSSVSLSPCTSESAEDRTATSSGKTVSSGILGIQRFPFYFPSSISKAEATESSESQADQGEERQARGEVICTNPADSPVGLIINALSEVSTPERASTTAEAQIVEDFYSPTDLHSPLTASFDKSSLTSGSDLGYSPALQQKRLLRKQQQDNLMLMLKNARSKKVVCDSASSESTGDTSYFGSIINTLRQNTSRDADDLICNSHEGRVACVNRLSNSRSKESRTVFLEEDKALPILFKKDLSDDDGVGGSTDGPLSTSYEAVQEDNEDADGVCDVDPYLTFYSSASDSDQEDEGIVFCAASSDHDKPTTTVSPEPLAGTAGTHNVVSEKRVDLLFQDKPGDAEGEERSESASPGFCEFKSLECDSTNDKGSKKEIETSQVHSDSECSHLPEGPQSLEGHQHVVSETEEYAKDLAKAGEVRVDALDGDQPKILTRNEAEATGIAESEPVENICSISLFNGEEEEVEMELQRPATTVKGLASKFEALLTNKNIPNYIAHRDGVHSIKNLASQYLNSANRHSHISPKSDDTSKYHSSQKACNSGVPTDKKHESETNHDQTASVSLQKHPNIISGGACSTDGESPTQSSEPTKLERGASTPCTNATSVDNTGRKGVPALSDDLSGTAAPIATDFQEAGQRKNVIPRKSAMKKNSCDSDPFSGLSNTNPSLASVSFYTLNTSTATSSDEMSFAANTAASFHSESSHGKIKRVSFAALESESEEEAEDDAGDDFSEGSEDSLFQRSVGTENASLVDHFGDISAIEVRPEQQSVTITSDSMDGGDSLAGTTLEDPLPGAPVSYQQTEAHNNNKNSGASEALPANIRSFATTDDVMNNSVLAVMRAYMEDEDNVHDSDCVSTASSDVDLNPVDSDRPYVPLPGEESFPSFEDLAANETPTTLEQFIVTTETELPFRDQESRSNKAVSSRHQQSSLPPKPFDQPIVIETVDSDGNTVDGISLVVDLASNLSNTYGLSKNNSVIDEDFTGQNAPGGPFDNFTSIKEAMQTAFPAIPLETFNAKNPFGNPFETLDAVKNVVETPFAGNSFGGVLSEVMDVLARETGEDQKRLKSANGQKITKKHKRKSPVSLETNLEPIFNDFFGLMSDTSKALNIPDIFSDGPWQDAAFTNTSSSTTGTIASPSPSRILKKRSSDDRIAEITSVEYTLEETYKEDPSGVAGDTSTIAELDGQDEEDDKEDPSGAAGDTSTIAELDGQDEEDDKDDDDFATPTKLQNQVHPDGEEEGTGNSKKDTNEGIEGPSPSDVRKFAFV